MNTNASLTRQAPQGTHFTWCKYGDAWVIASDRTDIAYPNTMDGTVVKVTRRNGTQSFQILGKFLAKQQNRMIWSNEGQVMAKATDFDNNQGHNLTEHQKHQVRVW